MSGFLQKENTTNFADTVNDIRVWSNKEVLEAVAALKKEPILAVDTENTGIDPYLGKPLLLQIGTEETCYTFPAYIGLDLSPLKELLENENTLLLLFNAKYDWKWLDVHYNIQMSNVFCLQVAERLLTVGLPNARRRPSLRDVVSKYLGIELSKTARKNFVDRDPEEDPITDAEFKYAAADVVLLPKVYIHQLAAIMEQGLDQVSQLEMDAIPAFSTMENAGVLIDIDGWNELIEEAKGKHDSIVKEIHKHFKNVVAQKNLFGLPTFNVASPSQLLENLQKLGFDVEDTGEETLKKYKNEHPVFPLLLRYRNFDKVIKAYGEKFLNKINKKTGRLHANFNQLLADTGRSSSSKPNLQQVKGYNPNDPDSLDFRSCFRARKGYKLITADFSQQEIRILACESREPVLIKAYTELDEDGEPIDLHSLTASEIFGVAYKKVKEDNADEKKGSPERKKAKIINFLIPYGGSAFAMAQQFNLPVEECEEFMEAYFSKMRLVKRYLDRCAKRGLNQGFITTRLGRRRNLPVPSQDDPNFRRMKGAIERKSKNTPIQAGGADVTKQAMVFLYKRLKREGYDARILMVVHDEFVVEVREDQAEEVSKIVEEEMVRGFSHIYTEVPMRVDAHIDNVWKK